MKSRKVTFAVLLSLGLPMGAQTEFFGFVDSDFNNASNWTNGLPSNGGNHGGIEVPVTLTDNFNTATGVSYDLVVNGVLNTGSFELQHRSGSNGRDVFVGRGVGESGILNVQNGGRLDIAGAGANLFIGSAVATGAVNFEEGSILQVQKTIELVRGSLTLAATSTQDGNMQDLLLVDKGTLTFQFASDLSYNPLVGQSIDVQLGSASILNLEFASPPSVGTTFDLLTSVTAYSGVSGSNGTGIFGRVQATGLAAGTEVQINYGATLQAEIVAAGGADPEFDAPPFVSFLNDGTATSYAVAVANVGATQALNISSVVASGFDAVDVSGIAFPATLASGANGSLTFDFEPTRGGGTYNFEFEVVSNDGASPTLLPVEIVVGDPQIEVVTEVVNFGSITPGTGPHTRSLSISNLGGTAGLLIDDLDSAVVSSGNEFSITSFPAEIAAGGSGNLEVTFDSGNVTGVFTGYLNLVSDDATGRTVRVGLYADVVSYNPELRVEESFSFVNDGITDDYRFDILNLSGDGTTALEISGVTASGPNASTVSNINPPSSVAAGESDFIGFDFTPTGPGIYSFNLEVASNDQSQVSPRVIPISIEVTDPLIGPVSNLDFGNLAADDDPQVQTLTISNLGGSEDLVIDQGLTSISGSSAFSITSFPGTIAPGGTGDLEVTLDPGSATGSFEATLAIESNDYYGTVRSVLLSAFVFPTGEFAAFDFGTATSPVAPDYQQFIVSEGASGTASGLSLSLTSRFGDLRGETGASGGNLATDSATTTFNGSAGNYISVLISGLQTGDLDIYAVLDFNSSFGLPQDVSFGEAGGSLTSVATGLSRPGEISYTAAVISGVDYELRITEAGNANLAYISGLLLSGSAIPGGTPFGTFVTAAGLDPASTGAPGLDPDGDGLETGIEWVVGGSPNDVANPDSDKVPSGKLVTADPDGDTIDADYLLFSFSRSDVAAADSATTIAVEFGTDLVSWATAIDGVDGVVIVETNDPVETGLDLVECYLPISLAVPGNQLFARLAVTVTP